MPNTKPLVTAALICENVIIENDGVPSIVRVVDRGTIEIPPTLPPDIQAAFQVVAFFAVKAGDLHGDYEFTVVIRSPDGKSATPSETWRVHLAGGETGGNLKLQLSLPAKPGLYWVDLTLRGEVLSSTPFTLALATPASISGQ
jgi:hypothetical protein